MNQRRPQVCAVLIGILFCCVGCGLQQEKQDQSAIRVTTGAALYIAGNDNSGEVQHQLEVLVENAPKWQIAGDEDRYDDEINYAVTDLDRNGRLEILALKKSWIEERSILQKFLEINPSGDGVEEIEIDPLKEVFLGEDMLENLDGGYYDPKTGECHYVMGNQMPEEEMLSDESGDYDKNIIALTLKQGRLTIDTLAYQMQTKNQNGKMESRFYQVNGTGSEEIDPSRYSGEGLGDAVYVNCEKYSVQFSPFVFDHRLEDMTEAQVQYVLEKSYRESSMGYPLGQQEREIAGQKIRIPQYTTMQDQKKQKRINRLIYDKVEQMVNQVYDPKDSESGLPEIDITIKYAERDRVSLLLKVSKSLQGKVQSKLGSHETVAQGNVIYDTINIDLEQDCILAEQDLVPESYRKEVIEEIEEEIEEEMEEEMEEKGESGKKQDSKEFYVNLLEHLEKWQEISLYQTRDMIGIVIPTGIASDPYGIREVWDESEDEYDRVSFAEVDWEAYQYKMLASEYQGLQDYMPVLTGGAEFIYQWEEVCEEDDKTVVKNQNMSISSWVGNYLGEEIAENFPVNYVCICDLTQDGKLEMILNFCNDIHLILHKEGNTYYGMMRGRRGCSGLQKNGVYGTGREVQRLYQMRFDKDHFVEEYLGRYEWHIMKDESIKEEYYIQNREVGKKVYEKWEKSIMDGEVSWYTPESMQEGREESGQ